jgi:hypothetical protein
VVAVSIKAAKRVEGINIEVLININEAEVAIIVKNIGRTIETMKALRITA